MGALSELAKYFSKVAVFGVVFNVFLFAEIFPAQAAEPVPGDACSTENIIIKSGGPETTGVGYSMICKSSVWVRITESDASGNVGIRKAAPKAPLHVGGEAIIGSTTGLACDADREGAIRYASSEGCIEFCNGTDWNCVASSVVLNGTNYVHYFLTQSLYTGNLGGQSGADTKCAADANAVSGKTYIADLSSTNWAIAGVQYAGNYGNGTSYVTSYNGISPEYWISDSGENCVNWSSSSSSEDGGDCSFDATAQIGEHTNCGSGSGWNGCDNPHPILCVEPVEVAASNPWSPPDGSFSYFLSNSLYNGNLGGQSGADAKCDADANAVSGKTYTAYLSTSNWALADTDYYGNYGNGTSYVASYNGISPEYWSEVSGDNCNNWSSSSSSNDGGDCSLNASIQIGEHTNCGSGSGWNGCDNPHPILCVETP